MTAKVKSRRSYGGSLVLGGLMSAAFFGLLSLPWFEGSSLRRYCLSHDVEKVTVIMFFWGLADLLVKARTFGRQRRALRHAWLADAPETIPAPSAGSLSSRIGASPNRLRETWIAQRLRTAVEFVEKRGSAEGL